VRRRAAGWMLRARIVLEARQLSGPLCRLSVLKLPELLLACGARRAVELASRARLSAGVDGTRGRECSHACGSQ
jgi:hypothetical protein